MASLAELLAGAEPLDNGFTVHITPDWLQGRTAYGGLTSAIALAAARNAFPDVPPLRSGQFSMIAPLAGRIEARARVVRKGRNVTWVASELRDDQGVGFSASFVFMASRPSVLAMPGIPLPDNVVAPADAPPLPLDRAPVFLRSHFEVRMALPVIPGTADIGCWARLREGEGLHPEVLCVACGDVLPAAAWLSVPADVPMSSTQWHVNVLDAAMPQDGWWLIRSTSEAATDGAVSERITQWHADGRLAMAGMQSVAVFG
ncbi:thioesterase family protein [Novosphingobium sp. Leaf2]|uniref:thioesterase family protein n=1 Tax=Novosphingobium sp. Leaf2 TaxID=1735670 RepID=UPI0007011AFA|nr:thioesterase family protein [Novosphingobium sp. Leaf2]KQM13806.1 hypothetical protein ASE49_12170 [Novosphingobium sp. Leaf2]